MATFKICVFKHQLREDGKYPVSIRVCWKRKFSYMKTGYYVTDKQINKKSFEVKDPYIVSDLANRIKTYEEIKKTKLGISIDQYSAKELAEYFEKQSQPNEDDKIDFIPFAKTHIERVKASGRKSTANTQQRTLNSLIDYIGRDYLYVTELTSKFLTGYEAYLKTEREMTRINQLGKPVTIKRDALSDVSVFDYMTDLRTLFNACREEYNDEELDQIRIFHYPFKKYKIKRVAEPEKRSLPAEDILKIFSVTDDQLGGLKRSIMARDVFILSFYLCGINTADLYNAKSEHLNDRLKYNRTKTAGRRFDNAEISIRIEPEVKALIEKYKSKEGADNAFVFSEQYSTSHVFGSAVNKGLKLVATACGVEDGLTTYVARHSWATIARNNCRVSMDDVDLCLNHAVQRNKMADVYVKKDFSLIDIANRKVADYLNELKEQKDS